MNRNIGVSKEGYTLHVSGCRAWKKVGGLLLWDSSPGWAELLSFCQWCAYKKNNNTVFRQYKSQAKEVTGPDTTRGESPEKWRKPCMVHGARISIGEAQTFFTFLLLWSKG